MVVTAPQRRAPGEDWREALAEACKHAQKHPGHRPEVRGDLYYDPLPDTSTYGWWCMQCDAGIGNADV